ncbi:MAG: hypothetical protein M1830_000380 [Pleopsidium flavum]|nr:MAG: hypothetical protein M1830_000380 [Pleopsidium flavum]
MAGRPVQQFSPVPPAGLSQEEQFKWRAIHNNLESITTFLAHFDPTRPALEAAVVEWNWQALPHEHLSHYRALPDKCSRWRNKLAELRRVAAAAVVEAAAARARARMRERRRMRGRVGMGRLGG